MTRLSKTLSLSSRSWEFLTFLIILIFIMAKMLWSYEVVPYDPEEVIKISFLQQANSLGYFFPGSHPVGALYGHPGLWQAITFVFNKVFGNSIIVIRALMLFTSIGLVGALYYFARKIAGRLYAFFCALCFITPPMFYFQSDLFFFELPALLFGVLALSFYHDRKVVPFFICALSAQFILESWVSLAVAVFVIELWPALGRQRVDLKFIKSSLLLIFCLVAFFICEYLATGSLSNHIVYLSRQSAGQGFFTVNGILDGSFGGLYLTFVENFGKSGSFLILGLVFLFALQVKNYWSNRTFWVSLFICVQVVTFFIFFDEASGGRDYYPLLLFSIALAIAGLRTLTLNSSTFAPLALTLWTFIFLNYLPSEIYQDSKFQTTFTEPLFSDSYEKLSDFIQTNLLTDEVSCLVKDPVGDIICNTFFDPDSEIDSFSRKKHFRGSVVIFSEVVSEKWKRRLEGYQHVEVFLSRRQLNLYFRKDIVDDIPARIFL